MKLFLALALSYTGFVASQTLILAAPAPLFFARSTAIAQTATYSWPQPPSDDPPGGRVRGGARRGTCSLANSTLTALAPFTEDVSQQVTNVWGLTTQANPTLWFYVPYANNSAYKTKFVLQDQQNNPIYQKAIALPERPGVIGISLPTNAPQLAVDKQYRWFLNISCNQKQPSPPIYVEGVIKRVNLKQAITKQFKTATLLEQSTIYAQNGIWHDALTTLAQLRQKNPQDKALEVEWKNLLASIRLDDVASQPILPGKLY
ncbi:DUF928 domain-containing protein [Nostocaceae cyanobacterium CENA369]|uniref:DUF928 domain-containing protein n=1 Tax=Dendronalium phyllosphericum CENA369 TaxID=1725256 RepID=A0A8J7LCF4_9NOST|nr:DUF928 domain-containing protein [Dendronalium phyllosphericum]MBH8571886.1 DUF928 domain-containing protein [Dendronalium phyllosphericum CENA369]